MDVEIFFDCGFQFFGTSMRSTSYLILGNVARHRNFHIGEIFLRAQFKNPLIAF